MCKSQPRSSQFHTIPVPHHSHKLCSPPPPCYTLLLQVIQRIGHWLLDAFGTAYIVPGFTAEALLALAFWPGAAQKDFSGYWAARFHVAVPDELVELLMPGLTAMEVANTQAAAARKPSKSAVHLAQVLRMGATVVVQDALELADKFPDNPVHRLLLEQDCFM